MSISKIKGKNVNIHLWAPIHEVESSAIDQLKNVAKLPWVFHHVAAMADVHTGKGATIGSVIAMRGAIAPSAVGVDIGCVDKDTEYLSPDGWRRISDYDGGRVMQYDAESGVGTFVEPQAFIKLPCDKFLRIKTKYGVDQMLSVEHKVLFAKYDRSFKFDKLDTIQAGDLVGHHNRTSQGFRGRFLTTFTPELETSLDLSDEQIRVAVMVAADGCFNSSSSETSTRCSLRLKKVRKIERARLLLKNAQIEFTEHTPGDGVTEIRFYATRRLKSLGSFWCASVHQLQLVADEVVQWDGNKENRCFYSRDKASADFVSYVFAALGFRSVMRADIHKRDGKTDYRVFFHYNDKVGINGPKKSQIEFVPSEDGLKYCFTLSSGFWVMRRGGVIAITGNCGMIAQRTNLSAAHLPDNLKELRAAIEAKVPVGFASHTDEAPGVDRLQLWGKRFKELPEGVQDREGHARLQCGTLGGGNHFIEVCLDTEDRVWLMLHSGSRNIGLRIANIAIKQAKKMDHNKGLGDLAVLLDGTPEMEAYKKGLVWAQEYAMENRRAMLRLVQGVVSTLTPFDVEFDPLIQCHHNYVAEETHYGEKVYVTRKGAISARAGEMAIIPGSMGTRSYIVEGLGSEEAFQSASHGAGRVMSRSKAKKTFTEDDIAEQLAGVVCRRDRGIIDELPKAYKDIDQVMTNQSDLVKVVAQIKQVICVKG
jgi:tRNA-splicing ligase RtcB